MTRNIVGFSRIIVGVCPQHRRVSGRRAPPSGRRRESLMAGAPRQGRFRLAGRGLIHYMTLIR
ncbi:MAG: hypothetical protein ACJ8DE_03900 [Microvirga sp.]|jgi:hypothetical protein